MILSLSQAVVLETKISMGILDRLRTLVYNYNVMFFAGDYFLCQ